MSQRELIRVDSALKRRSAEAGLLRPRGLVCVPQSVSVVHHQTAVVDLTCSALPRLWSMCDYSQVSVTVKRKYKWIETPMTLCSTLKSNETCCFVGFFSAKISILMVCVWDFFSHLDVHVRCLRTAQNIALWTEGKHWWKRTSCPAGSSPEVQRAYIKLWVIATAPSSLLASALPHWCDYFKAISSLYLHSVHAEKRLPRSTISPRVVSLGLKVRQLCSTFFVRLHWFEPWQLKPITTLWRIIITSCLTWRGRTEM